MGLNIGGKNERFHRVHGDIVASYTYVNGERAMILYPLHRRNKITPFILCDSSAFKYTDPVYLAQQAKVCCELWGWEASTQAWYRIAKVMDEGLVDLIKLPPLPSATEFGKPIGEAVLMVGGREVVSGEVDGARLEELSHYGPASGAVH